MRELSAWGSGTAKPRGQFIQLVMRLAEGTSDQKCVGDVENMVLLPIYTHKIPLVSSNSSDLSSPALLALIDTSSTGNN